MFPTSNRICSCSRGIALSTQLWQRDGMKMLVLDL
jgi:hypothetical protein